jgi:diacylglycerol O-acyltransferase
MAAGKALLRSMSQREATLFMQITQIPALLTSVLGVAANFPAFSTVISNVPGPREQLYWNGASLEGVYPASIVFDGFAMNITLVSYRKQLDFGIVACRRSMPQVQRIIDYLEEALTELEELAGLRVAPRRPGRSRVKAAAGSAARASTKTATKTKTAAKTKPKSRQAAGSKAAPRARPKRASKPKTAGSKSTKG